MNLESILFLTTTIGTRWVFYQQFLLKKFFPNAKRVLIDGNVRWDFNKELKCVWYDFIFIALKNKKKYKYFIHIDEDCFITNPNGIKEVIEYMDREGIDLMGPSEVIKRIRGENPYALNSFFMIGKIETLEKVMREYQINLKFSSLNLECDIDEYKKEYEPYYDFFWNYYKKGYKISFLSTDFDEEYRCTSLLDNKGTPFGFHM